MESSLLEKPVESLVAPSADLEVAIDPAILDMQPIDFTELEADLNAEVSDRTQLEESGESLEQRPTFFKKILRAMGQTAIGKAAAVEGAGMLVDVGLNVAGAVGVSPLSHLPVREAIASGADGVVLKHLNKHNTHEDSNALSKAKHIGKVVMFGLIGYGVQKAGFSIEGHVSEVLKAGAAHTLFPVGMKVAATTGFQSATKRVGI